MTTDIKPTADLVDEYPRTIQSCDVQFSQFGGRASFQGPIRTVRCHEDNLVLKSILAMPGDGCALVVDGQGSLHCALLGDAMAALAVENGWAGIVLFGAVRDVARLRTMDIGIKALGSNPRKSTKVGKGAAGVAVHFGGVNFVPGATLISDDDGIVVLQ